MLKSEVHRSNAYVNLSVEALWLARAIHDGLDLLLDEPAEDLLPDSDRMKVLAISRDVFERLGAYSHSNGSVNVQSEEWTAASRTEFIRQVAVHWRAFLDASFGKTFASEMIMTLTHYEIRVLAQVLRLDKEIKANKENVVFCMGQELNAELQHQNTLRTLRYSCYLDSARSRTS
jgi:hypothetical protein